MTSYDDIIHLPYPRAGGRPRMPRRDRAAQFAPFAALEGYHEKIRALEREKIPRPVLDAEQTAELNQNLRALQAVIREKPRAAIRYFRKNADGSGQIHTLTACVVHIDLPMRTMKLDDGMVLALDDILALAPEGRM